MWIIGLVLLAAAVVVGIEIGISSNDRSVDIEAFSHVWTSNAAAAFLVGVITALVGAFGLWLMFTGMRRSRVRRRARRAELNERDRLADERRREIEAMSSTGRGNGHDRAATTAATTNDYRERVPADRRDEDVDLRDRHDDSDMHDERRNDVRDPADEQQAEHRGRGDVLHRSDR
jgi:ABC-type nickel/cobalt efflux system permease component RcnA